MSCQQSLVLILFAITLCCAHEHFYCGRSLARAIAALCFKDNHDKRSDSTMYNTVLRPYYKDEEARFRWDWPLYKAKAMSLSSRGKRLVVNECCDKPCTLSELLSYCDY